MLKKILISSTLVAASAMIANAATVLTTNFVKNSATNVTATTIETTDLLGSLTSTAISSTVDYMTAGYLSNVIVAPNINIGTGGTYTTTLTYVFGSDYTNKIDLSGIEFDINLLGAGGYQSTANVREIDFSLSIKIDNVEVGTASFDGGLPGNGIAGTGNLNHSRSIVFDFSSQETLQNISLAGKTVDIMLGVIKDSANGTEGCFVGFDEVRVNGALAIPEPSMFGLFAGLGALALVGSRRRRK